MTFGISLERFMAIPMSTHLNERASELGNAITIAEIRHELGISRERMARLLDVSSRTVARWEEQGQLPSNRWVRQALLQISAIIDVARESLTEVGLHAIMTTPQPVFGNRSGLEMIEQGQMETVYRELAGMAEGYAGS